ncbi:hypothetical protein CJF31_00010725 [Rutstroemia sp. NJR-2017a BVV2]|nr:hypothetical protein CJF31_00010725 [Rutstroemia sp. NJR-2017a BVV2]
MHYQFSFALLASLAAAAAASPSSLSARSGCQQGYTLCSPSGATNSNTPEIGDPEFTHLYEDIVLSNLPTFTSRKRTSSRNNIPFSLLSPRASASLCCISSLACLTMHNLNIPFCYDQFTTNYFLPDNSYGTIVGGSYTSASGAHADLATGNFTKADGTSGNIYSADPGSAPNTATLPIPSQYTASGVGSAIPASVLGGVTVTYTTTYSASAVPGTTVGGTTEIGGVSTLTTGVRQTVTSAGETSTSQGESTWVTTVPGTTVQGTTRAESTVSASVGTVTRVESVGSGSASVGASASASATGKKNAGVREGLGRGALVVGLVGGVWGLL